MGRHLGTTRSRTRLYLDHVLWWRSMRHARRVEADTRSSQHKHDAFAFKSQRQGPRRGMDTAQDLQFLDEPIPRPHHPSLGPNDELSSSTLGSLNHGSQAMGHSLCGLRFCARSHLHLDLYLSTYVLPSVSPAV